jgi:hypothetical protein
VTIPPLSQHLLGVWPPPSLPGHQPSPNYRHLPRRRPWLVASGGPD